MQVDAILWLYHHLRRVQHWQEIGNSRSHLPLWHPLDREESSNSRLQLQLCQPVARQAFRHRWHRSYQSLPLPLPHQFRPGHAKKVSFVTFDDTITSKVTISLSLSRTCCTGDCDAPLLQGGRVSDVFGRRYDNRVVKNGEEIIFECLAGTSLIGANSTYCINGNLLRELPLCTSKSSSPISSPPSLYLLPFTVCQLKAPVLTNCH